MTSLMSDSWFNGLDPRRDLRYIRSALQARVEAGVDSTAVLRSLADRDPVAVAELLLGPRAISGAGMTRSSLGLVDVLEQALSPSALYRRLGDLAEDAGEEVLRVAVDRHPDAAWLVSLSARIEGPMAGRLHLFRVAERPSFMDVCEAYAAAGARAGLVEVAAVLGRIEPFCALAQVDDRDALIEAAVATLARRPDAPVVVWLAAVWGTELGSLLVEIVDRVSSRGALEAMRGPARRWPPVARRIGEHLLGSGVS